MRTLAAVFVGLFACTPSGPGPADDKPPVTPTGPEATPNPEATPTPDPEPIGAADPPPKATKIEVHMTSATLADDCGGGPNRRPSPESLEMPKRANAKAKTDASRGAMAKGKRACEQSSIQLAIAAPADATPTKLTVKSVEVLRESGELVGKVEVRAPSVWSETGGYTPWNENIEPAQELSVTYAMTQPNWASVADRWNQTFTVKAVISIAGTDQTVEHAVEVDAPTSLPPGVKT